MKKANVVPMLNIKQALRLMKKVSPEPVVALEVPWNHRNSRVRYLVKMTQEVLQSITVHMDRTEVYDTLVKDAIGRITFGTYRAICDRLDIETRDVMHLDLKIYCIIYERQSLWSFGNPLWYNQGFPKGFTYRDLKPGRVVEVVFRDYTESQFAVILNADNNWGRPTRFERDVQILMRDSDGGWDTHYATHNQIVGYGPMLDLGAIMRGEQKPTLQVKTMFGEGTRGRTHRLMLVSRDGAADEVACLSSKNAKRLTDAGLSSKG